MERFDFGDEEVLLEPLESSDDSSGAETPIESFGSE
jgi:hypothetical protein